MSCVWQGVRGARESREGPPLPRLAGRQHLLADLQTKDPVWASPACGPGASSSPGARGPFMVISSIPSFLDGGTEAQRREAVCPRSPTKSVTVDSDSVHRLGWLLLSRSLLPTLPHSSRSSFPSATLGQPSALGPELPALEPQAASGSVIATAVHQTSRGARPSLPAPHTCHRLCHTF